MKITGWICAIMLLAGCGFASAQQEDTAGEKSAAAPPTRMTPELLWKLGRLGEAAVSADGSKIIYTVRRYELEKDQGKSSLHLIDAKTNGHSEIVENWKSVGSVQWAKSKNG